MFSSKCNYPKLKTNLRLVVNRLKLLEKKKTELALKSRKEIADYIQAGKEDRARIRVEHIVREDYMVEGMEILEMFCDLLLARFGIIERVSAIDPTIEEAIASVIWCEPRLSADVNELTIISKNLMARYGKEYHAACKANTMGNVNDKLMRKMSIYSPPKMLIENYMVEIAKSFNVEFTPDPLALLGEDGIPLDDLIGLGGDFKAPGGDGPGNPPPPPSQPPSGGGGGYPPPSGGGGGGGYPQAQYPPQQAAYPPPQMPPQQPVVYPTPQPLYPPQNDSAYPPPVPTLPPAGPAGGQMPPAGAFNIPPNIPPQGANGEAPRPPTYSEKPPPSYSTVNMRNDLSSDGGPGASAAPSAPAGEIPSLPEIPGTDDFNLPSVPSSTNPGAAGPPGNGGGNDIDFDDLAARFENLKKRK